MVLSLCTSLFATKAATQEQISTQDKPHTV